MILAPDFFQPTAFYKKKFSCISQIYDATYWSHIHDFMDRVEQESPKDAKQLYNILRIYFNSTDTDAGCIPLNDKERFWILRAIAKIPFEQRSTVIVLAMDLSPQRPNYEILEALCLVNCHWLRGTEFRKPNTIADMEWGYIDPHVRDLIHRAICLVSGKDEHDAYNNKIILARYFLAEKELDGKKALAEKTISSLSTAGIFVLPNQVRFIAKEALDRPPVPMVRNN
jgi:hypothetical protein